MYFVVTWFEIFFFSSFVLLLFLIFFLFIYTLYNVYIKIHERSHYDDSFEAAAGSSSWTT